MEIPRIVITIPKRPSIMEISRELHDAVQAAKMVADNRDPDLPVARKDVVAALTGSILKWREIVDGTGGDYGTLNCPLCVLFVKQRCQGCPVAEAVGETGCSHTPQEWFDAAIQEDQLKAEGTTDASVVSVVGPISLMCAENELAFLRRLRADMEE